MKMNFIFPPGKKNRKKKKSKKIGTKNKGIAKQTERGRIIVKITLFVVLSSWDMFDMKIILISIFCFVFYSNKLRQQTNESEKQRSSFISPAASALMDHDITTNLNRPTRLSWKSLHFVMAEFFFSFFGFYSSRDYYILSLETANPSLEYNSIRKKKKITLGKFQKNKKETDADAG